MFLNRISTKLAMVGFSFTLPIATMLSLMIAAKQKDIDFALQETRGNSYQRPLAQLLENLSNHRITAQRARYGDTESAEKLSHIRANIEQNLHELTKTNARLGKDLQFTSEALGKRKRGAFTAQKLTKDLNRFLAKDPKTVLNNDYAHFFTHIRTMITPLPLL